MTISYNPAFPAGTKVTGKWNGGNYIIEGVLGSGANGQVYLVTSGKMRYAMKMGYDGVDHQSEVNSLLSISKLKKSQDPFLYDVDNFTYEGKDYPFYVMKWIRGKNIRRYMKEKGKEQLPVFSGRLLQRLCHLHEAGWVFGDLKPENILVTDAGGIELIDFGGMTPIGRSVRQFTELYDRGYWNAGSRKADETYDLFSFAVMYLQLAGRERELIQATRMLPQNRTPDLLLEWARQDGASRKVFPVLKKAVLGQYSTSAEVVRDWLQLVPAARIQSVGHQGPTGRGRLLGGLLACSVMLLAFAVYLIAHT